MGKFARVSRLKHVPTRFHTKTGNSSQTRNPSKRGYASLLCIRPLFDIVRACYIHSSVSCIGVKEGNEYAKRMSHK